jgi:hypothetical protein
MPSTHKKVIVRKLDRDSLTGYVAGSNFVADDKLELLTQSGKVIFIDLREVKGVYFVRDFGDTESLGRKTFTTRPRSEGLWIRIEFVDNDVLEGLMPNDLTLLTGEGYLIIPPDTRSNTQRIFVPRAAVSSFTVLSVIGGAIRRRKEAKDTGQVAMFDEEANL